MCINKMLKVFVLMFCFQWGKNLSSENIYCNLTFLETSLKRLLVKVAIFFFPPSMQ